MATHQTDSASGSVLITGVTGYIGFQTLNLALIRGHHVRAVVRSEKHIQDLETKSKVIAEAHKSHQLEFAVVPDFLEPGALQETFQGITTILHLASPLAIQVDDYDEGIIKPAVAMVTVVLEAALSIKTIQRVVLTSSCVTLVPFEWNMNPDSDKIYSASDVNTNPTKPYKSAMEAYWASKAFARAVPSDFVKMHQPHFDFVNLLPSVVIGPDERISPGGEAIQLLQGTRAAVMAPALDSSLNSPFPYVGVPVHVKDVARAHVDAVNVTRVPGNTEYILSSDTPEGVVWDRDVHAIARRHFAKEVDDGTLPLQGSLVSIKWQLDATKTEETFGWRFTTFGDTMRGLIAQYLTLKNTV